MTKPINRATAMTVSVIALLAGLAGAGTSGASRRIERFSVSHWPTNWSADVAVLTVEYKINLLRPAGGDRLVARARVVRSGQTLTVCTGDVFARTGDTERIVATMLATLTAVPQREGLRQ